MEGRGHGPTLPTNRLGAASALGTACGGTSQSGIRGVAERGGSAHYQGCDGQWERRGRGDGGGTCGRARVRVGQPQPGRNRRRCRDSATGSGTGTEGRGERHRAGTAPPQRPPPAGDSTPWNPPGAPPVLVTALGRRRPPEPPQGPPGVSGAVRGGRGGTRSCPRCRAVRSGQRMGMGVPGTAAPPPAMATASLPKKAQQLPAERGHGQNPTDHRRPAETRNGVEVMLKVWFPHVAPKAGPEPDPVGVLLLLRDRRSAHGDGATSGTSGGTSGTASGVTAETTPTGTTQPKCPLPTRTGAPTPPAAPDV
eukprot:XP_024999425.1 circadian-associated transcriptional repressor isoform X1 [Gallus gallus]